MPPADGGAEKSGPAQLDRYITGLQKMPRANGDTRSVRRGGRIGTTPGPVPNIADPN